MPQCCFAGCHNRTDDGKGLSFFRFPRRDKERTVLWSRECGRDNFTPTEHSRVCSEHFRELDFERDLKAELIGGSKKRLRLKDTAVPRNKLLRTLRGMSPASSNSGESEIKNAGKISNNNLRKGNSMFGVAYLTSKAAHPNNNDDNMDPWEEEGSMEVESSSSSQATPIHQSHSHLLMAMDEVDGNEEQRVVMRLSDAIGNNSLVTKNPLNEDDFQVNLECIEALEKRLEEVVAKEAEAAEMENDDDHTTLQRLLVQTVMRELEKEEAKLLLLQKIWINQNTTKSSSSDRTDAATSNKNGNHEHRHGNSSFTNGVANESSRATHSSGSTLAHSMSSPGNLAKRHNGAAHSMENILPPMASTLSHASASSTSLSQQHATSLTSNSGLGTSSSTYPTNAPPLPKLSAAAALQNLEQNTLAKRSEWRRSVEEAMLAIPLPNPNSIRHSHHSGAPNPWAEMLPFVPTPTSTEFIHLLGLEEVVSEIQEYDLVASGQPPLNSATKECSYEPFVCADCGTDFTPQWKRKADVMATLNSTNRNKTTSKATVEVLDEKAVLCEACVVNLRRQRLRKDYTRKIQDIARDGLVKEREIEAEFKRIRTDPSEFEKYHREQERKLQAPHVALYGNGNNNSTSGNQRTVTNLSTVTNLNPNIPQAQPSATSSTQQSQSSRHGHSYNSNAYHYQHNSHHHHSSSSSAASTSHIEASTGVRGSTYTRSELAGLNSRTGSHHQFATGGLGSSGSQRSSNSTSAATSSPHLPAFTSPQATDGGLNLSTANLNSLNSSSSLSSSSNANANTGANLNPASLALLNTLLAQQAAVAAAAAASSCPTLPGGVDLGQLLSLNLLANTNTGGASSLPNELQMLVLQSLLAASMQQQQQPRSGSLNGMQNLSTLFSFLQQQQPGGRGSH